jgi:hypothetical protein
VLDRPRRREKYSSHALLDGFPRISAVRRRRGFPRQGSVLGGRFGLLAEVLFALAWLGFAGYFFYHSTSSLVQAAHLRIDGVRAIGTALHSRSQEVTSADSDGGTSTETFYYTTVRFRDADNETRTVEIDGFYRAERPVSLIYLPGHPESVRPSSSIKASGIVWSAFGMLFSLTFVIFGLAFFRTWFSDF